MSPPSPRSEQRPIVFIFGCTGTGKSDMGVEICLKYGGEVVNADSLQIYNGLDIATNKITEDEKKGVIHHLLGFVSPTTQYYNVQAFRDTALEAFFLSLLAEPPTTSNHFCTDNLIETGRDSDDSGASGDEEVIYRDLSNEELHNRLKQVDPESAALVHPNNRRRVYRAIEIFHRTGQTKSAAIEEQKNATDGKLGRLRFARALLLYLDAPREILDGRLDKRVEKMRTGGLRKEIDQFWEKYSSRLDGRRFGIMQCIGLKEFLPYVQYFDSIKDKERDEKDREKASRLFEEGIQQVQLHTRQYSTSQRKWIRNRFIRAQHDREVPAMACLDSSSPAHLFSSGLEVTRRFLAGEAVPMPEFSLQDETREESNRLFHCEVCAKSMTGRLNFEAHNRGKSHKHAVSMAKATEKKRLKEVSEDLPSQSDNENRKSAESA